MARPIGSKNYGWDKAELERMYITEGLSSIQIAKVLGVTGTAVRQAMEKFGLKRRTLSQALSGEKHYAWQGGKTKTSTGYIEVYMPEHHRANKRKRVYEHILIWEEANGRRLRKDEVIHHLNGIKTDNSPLNLLALRNEKHRRWIPALQKRIRDLENELKNCCQSVMNFDTLERRR